MNDLGNLCTGAQKQKTDTAVLSRVTEYVDKIIKYWRKAADISAVAGLCAGANKELSRKEKKEFYSGLPFGRTVFCKLARIGSDPRLHQEGIDTLLPANYSMQYEITKLTDEELQAAIDQNIIHTRAKRADLLDWIRARRETDSRRSQWLVQLRGVTEIKHEDDVIMGAMKRAWDKAVELKACWRKANDDARERFIKKVLRAPVRL